MGEQRVRFAVEPFGCRFVGATRGTPDFLFEQAVSYSQLGIEQHIASRGNPFALVGVEARRHRVRHESTHARNHQAVVVMKQQRQGVEQEIGLGCNTHPTCKIG